MSETFLWHDYETWGSDPRLDRPCQFAAIRTDLDLRPVGEPLVSFCRPAMDLLPVPEACLVTGITPQHAEREGLAEAQFAALVNDALGRPGTCGVGYNSLRFDDEITRHLLYRNLMDPYAREWRNGNSRWDLIDTVRAAFALRPDGIRWPTREDGTASFKLEHLTAANGIEHIGAHDALADVRATIALARLLRDAQPRLYAYALRLRDKRRVRAMLDAREPLLHVSARYPAAQGCIAPVMPLAAHPLNGNGVICFDLRADPAQLMQLSVEEIRTRLFTPSDQLPADRERVPLKTVQVNRSPILAPMATLTAVAAERWAIDPAGVAERARVAKGLGQGLAERVREVFQEPARVAPTDPDLMLYSGGFLSDHDRRALDDLRQCAPEELGKVSVRFEDARLPEMLFRYRARNWPESLTPVEREAWDDDRLVRLTEAGGGASIQADTYLERLGQLAEERAGDPRALSILRALEAWGERVLDASA